MKESYDKQTDLESISRLSSSHYTYHYLQDVSLLFLFKPSTAIADGCNHQCYCYCNGLAVHSTAVLVIVRIK